MPGNGVFSILPYNFFTPLTGVNREHYGALLVLYYRLFQESTRGLERELVIREFVRYVAQHRDRLAEEEEGQEVPAGTEAPPEEQEAELDFGIDAPRSYGDDRVLGNRFLRRLVATGWLGEETLSDFTRVINITAWAKPFFESLVRLDEGLKTEYESHVVNVYSSLCGETVKENGHFMVLKAREEARSLIDSLKVLSQNIKGYYDKLNARVLESPDGRSRAAEVLHQHYDLYAGEVLDTAYKRLKTSDNVSRYRQSIFKQITELLRDDEWLDLSAGKYTRILQTGREDCKKRLRSMLEEIREDLRSVDPLEDEIDRRNADYSRSSTEIIRAYIEPDSTVAGKIGLIIKSLYSGEEGLRDRFAHGLYRISFLSPSSLTLRRRREEGDFSSGSTPGDREALEKAEREFIERMRRRLSLVRIQDWLDGQGGRERPLASKDLVRDGDSFVHFIYALLYGDSRRNFEYLIEEELENENGKNENGEKKYPGRQVSSRGYVIPDIRFRRKA
jgi:hypothetical protein